MDIAKAGFKMVRQIKSTAEKRKESFSQFIDVNFSKQAQEVFTEIKDVNSNDEGIDHFARKIAQILTVYDHFGVVDPNKPMGYYFLVGSKAAPLRELALAVARSWIGIRYDGGPSFIEIDCAKYQSDHPMALAELLGPSSFAESNPILTPEVLGLPHFVATNEAKIKTIEWWYKSIPSSELDKLSVIFTQKTGAELNLQNALMNVHSQALGRLFLETGEHPVVLIISNVERATPHLLNLLHTMVSTARVSLHDTRTVNLNPCLMLFLYSDDDHILPVTVKRPIGFRQSEQNKQNRRSIYTRAREALIKNLRFGPIVNAVGDRLIVIGERTEKSQRQLVDDVLDRITLQFDKINLVCEFTDLFRRDLMAETYDEVLGAYVDSRLQSRLEALIWYPLVCVLNAHKNVYETDTIKFDYSENEVRVSYIPSAEQTVLIEPEKLKKFLLSESVVSDKKELIFESSEALQWAVAQFAALVQKINSELSSAKAKNCAEDDPPAMEGTDSREDDRDKIYPDDNDYVVGGA